MNPKCPRCGVGLDSSLVSTILETGPDLDAAPEQDYDRLVAQVAADPLRYKLAGPFPKLTEREQAVLDQVALGRSFRQIAKELFISENTVRNHLRNVGEKNRLATKIESAGRTLFVYCSQCGAVIDSLFAPLELEPIRTPAPPSEAEQEALPSELRCSFCGKGQKKVEKLIAGPGVYICNECVDLCQEIVNEEKPPGE